MRKQLLGGLASAALTLLAGTAALAQSAYFQAMTNLNPAVYFPLQETNPPPANEIETNLGSLGTAADAVYVSSAIQKSQAGATGDGDTAVNDTDAAGGFLAVPITDGRTAVTNSTFTVEVWVNSAEPGRNFEGILSKAGGNNAGINAAANIAGWCLSQNYNAYLDNANFRGWDFHVYNGIGHAGAEVYVPFSVVNNTWYHLVATFDGANCRLYVNGVDMVAAGNGFQISMPGGTTYVPDMWNQLCIGTSRNQNGNNYHGLLDEVAIYTNVLTAGQVLAHYNAAAGVSYASTVQADAPYMYWRMDAPAYTAPDPTTTYPVATNYGTLAPNFLGSYGTASQPGVAGSQAPGMLDPGNGNASYGVQINGIGGNNGNTANVPIGYDTNGVLKLVADAVPIIIQPDAFSDPNAIFLNPTNHSPYSVSIWFAGGSYDWNRFATIMGHSDSNWRLAMANGGNYGKLQFAPGIGNNGAVVTQLRYNDNLWHHFVGVYDGTNVLVYVDGRLDNTNSNAGPLTSSRLNVILGGDPQYINCGNAVPAAGNGFSINGGYPPQRDFCGKIAHFAFFTNVLTAGQILNLYTNASGGTVLPTVIGSQPATGRVNPAPGFLFFGVGAVGSAPLAYQWFFNTTSNYAGATMLVDDGVKYTSSTTSQLTISNLVAGDSGYYYVVVSNSVGSVTSILASLSINYTPVITAQSPAASFTLFSGQEATLSVTAISTTNSLLYQWYVGGVADPNGTNALYVSAPVTTAGTSFYCIVSNLYGSATSLTVSASTLLPLPASLTNSPFGSNILALQPTAYWPMHETGAPTTPGNNETNYGSLGSAANGTYGDWRSSMQASLGLTVAANTPTNVFVLHGIPGAIKGDPNPAVNFAAGNGSFVATPRTSPGTTLKPPFTIEAWVRPANNPSFMIAIGNDSGNLNATGNRGGFDWLYSGGTPNCFSMAVFNGNGGASAEPKTTASYPPGQWYHVVTTFDGTNVAYYINGVQDPLINSPTVNTNTATGQGYNPNTWDPITIGCGRGLGGNSWQGSMDEVAIYTNLLPVNVITNHYYAGTNGSPDYKSLVLASSPLIYYRMDAPIYTPPDISTWPVLTNYGLVGINGVYSPNSVPGGGTGPSVSGVPIAGFAASTSLQSDGVMTFADAGFVPQFSPTGKTPFTAAAWMKGNPADASRGWQTLVGHGDSAWRMVLDGNGAGTGNANFNAGPGGGSDIGNTASKTTPNDGQWHYVVGTFDGTNSTVYVDGIATATASNATANITGQAVDVCLGGYPSTTVFTTPDHIQRTVAFEANATGNGNGRVLAGNLCEAAFWNGKALSPGQINALYQSLQVVPHVLVQPVSSASVNQNSAYTNSPIFAGSLPIAYQWYQNGVPKANQTNASLGLPNVQPSDASTNYFVVATNLYGSATSAVVSLTVFSTPTIIQQPVFTNVTLYAGGHATFSIVAAGAVPLRYQWSSNSAAIGGATNASYNLTNAQPPNATNTYFCTVTNSAGATNSLTVTVTILPIPSVIPYSQAVLMDNPLGYWPLNEAEQGGGNPGVIANDYWAGNDGVYTNTILQQPGFNSADTNGTSAEFGIFSFVNGFVQIPANVDFSATNVSATFSVEAWVNGYQQTVDAGIVSKGVIYNEEFGLDCGFNGGSPQHAFRFFVRTANGAAFNANSTIQPGTTWHHLVGVCDEVNGTLRIYVDGVMAGSNSIPVGSGILASTNLMQIGARPGSADPNNNSLQFVGFVQDVAVYTNALSAAQVLNHFNAADIPAAILVPPANTTASEFGTASFSATVEGTPPISYQWFLNSVAIGSATNATLVLTNVQSGDNGNTYYLQVANAFGTNDSSALPATLTVISGMPQILVDVPAQIFVLGGGTISDPVSAFGTLPLHYQWQFNGVDLADGSRISGSQSNVLTIGNALAGDAGGYQVIVTNTFGSVTSSVSTLNVGSLPISFNTNGVGWNGNQGAVGYTAPFVAAGVLTLTENVGSQVRSLFFNYPQYIGAFKAAFTYQDGSGAGNVADGVAFILQNDPRGTSALGGAGGSLGVSGIVPSFELELNLYAGAGGGMGYSVNTNGNIGPNTLPGSINFASGDPIGVTVYYANGNMALTFTDAVAHASFSTNRNVGDLTQVAGGSTAYIGFSGATGGANAIQTISNFSFVSIPTEAIQLIGTNVFITWPGAISGYGLQQNSDLTTTNWVNVANLNNITNGLNQVIVPVSGSNEFYRLRLQP